MWKESTFLFNAINLWWRRQVLARGPPRSLLAISFLAAALGLGLWICQVQPSISQLRSPRRLRRLSGRPVPAGQRERGCLGVLPASQRWNRGWTDRPESPGVMGASLLPAVRQEILGSWPESYGITCGNILRRVKPEGRFVRRRCQGPHIHNCNLFS